MPPKLGLVAGSGPLPGHIVQSCHQAGRALHVVALEGEADAALIAGTSHDWVRLGAVGRVIQTLHRVGAQEVVLAGPVRRPSLKSLRPDMRGAKLLARAARRGVSDDALFSVIVEELESEGFRVVGADDLLGELLAPEGALGAHGVPDDAARDIALGVRAAGMLGALDIGQAVVVQEGVVLGVEAIEGTDALLARVATLRRPGPGGVLVKLKKPAQERRVDLPTIGPRTIANAHDAGLRGIAVEAGATLVLDRRALVAAADAAGMFVTGLALAPMSGLFAKEDP